MPDSVPAGASVKSVKSGMGVGRDSVKRCVNNNMEIMRNIGEGAPGELSTGMGGQGCSSRQQRGGGCPAGLKKGET